MAWTDLTYAFESVLTSAKMTQNQDNFTALAQGLTGSPKILNAAVDAVAAIAYSKLDLAGSVVDADISSSAGIVASKISGVGAKVYRSSGDTNVLDDTIHTINFDLEEYDTDGMHSTSTNTSRLTVQTAGKYLVWATVFWQSNATGYRATRLVKNTESVSYAEHTANAVSGDLTNQTVVFEDDFVVDDYMQVKIYQNSGSTLTIYTNGRFGMRLVG